MLNKIIGIIMLAYCGLATAYWQLSDFTPDTRFYLQLLVAGIGGLCITGYEFYPIISNLSIPKNNPKTKPVTKDNTMDDSSLKDHELQDFKCLIYLRNRMKNAENKEGEELVAKLNIILFSINSGKE